jgi:hypothetical protein
MRVIRLSFVHLAYQFTQVHNVKEYHTVRKNTKYLPGKLSTNTPARNYVKYSLNSLVARKTHSSIFLFHNCNLNITLLLSSLLNL